MTDLSADAIQFLLFIVPGLVSLEVFRLWTPVARRDAFEIIVGALVLSLLNKAVFFAFDRIPLLGDWEPFRDASVLSYWRIFHQEGGFLLLMTAAFVGVVAGQGYREWFRRSARVDVWNDVLGELRPNAKVLVVLKNGTCLVGTTLVYSTEIGVHEICLADAWNVTGGARTKVPGETTLLTRECEIVRVDVLKGGFSWKA